MKKIFAGGQLNKRTLQYLIVEGGSGVGKTRMGWEVARSLPASLGRVCVTRTFVPMEDADLKTSTRADGEHLLRQFAAKQSTEDFSASPRSPMKQFMTDFAERSGRSGSEWLLWIIQIDEFQIQLNRSTSVVEYGVACSQVALFSHFAVRLGSRCSLLEFQS